MKLRLVSLLLTCALIALSASSARAGEPHVLVITIDGFAQSLFADPAAPIPTFRRLAAEGVTSARGMTPVNPTVTWPNHTSIVTGVSPARHGCLANGVIVRGEPGRPAHVNNDADQKELVAVPTIFDLLHAAGISTAAINWPCTRNSASLDDNFADVPSQVESMTPRLRDELQASGVLPPGDGFYKLSGQSKDQVWTEALCHVIRARKPRFMLWHFLTTDALNHRYGPGSPASLSGLAMADAHLRQVLEALDEAGIRKDTTIFVLADHGFETAQKLVLPNVALRKGGLLRASAASILKCNVHVVSEGGIGLLYLANPETADTDRAKSIELLKDLEGVESIVTPDHYAALGLPDPAKNRQMADLILSAKPGYAFSNTAIGDDPIASTSPTLGTMGHHGYLNTYSKMRAVFIASGRGIKKGAMVESVRSLDIAPTVAKLLGQEMKDVEGKVLTEVMD